MKTNFLLKSLTLLGVVSIVLLHSCNEEDPISNTNTNTNSYDAALQQYLKKYEVVKLDYNAIEKIAKEKPSGFVSVNLNIPSKPNWNFQLTSDDLSQDKTADFAVYSVGDNYTLTQEQTPESFALKGKLANTESNSYFIMGNGWLEGSIADQDQKYFIEPVSKYAENVDEDLYVVYNTNDLYPVKIGEDMVGDLENKNDQLVFRGNANNPWKVEVTMLGDYQLYLKLGTKDKKRYIYVYNYLFYRNYFVNRIHIDSKTCARTVVKLIYVHTTYATRYYPPNSSNISTALAQFKTNYNLKTYKPGDMNYCVTGDKITSIAVGLASYGGVCIYPQNAFGLGVYYPAGTLANNLMAHETGHLMGLWHDDTNNKNIMNSYLNEGNVYFTNKSKDQLQSYFNKYNSCLSY